MSNDIEEFERWFRNNPNLLHKEFLAPKLQELRELGIDEYLNKHRVNYEYPKFNRAQKFISGVRYDEVFCYIILAWIRWRLVVTEEGYIYVSSHDAETNKKVYREKVDTIQRNQELKDIIEKVKEQLKEEIDLISKTLNLKDVKYSKTA